MENINQEEMIPETPVVEQPQEEAPKTTFLTGTPLGGTAVEGALNKATPYVDKAVAAAKKVDKKIWIIAGAAIVALIAVLIIFGSVGNTYKSPLDEAIKIRNLRETKDPVEDSLALLNGVAKSEVEDILDILKKSDNYEENIEDAIESLEESVEENEDEYGDGYKFSYKVDDKEELEKSDLRDFRSEIKDMAKNLEALVEQTDDWDSDQWEEMADSMDLRKSELKDLIKAYEALADELKDVEVTDGYELDVYFYVDSKDMDEAEELDDEYVNVYKVNGRWVSEASFSVLSTIMPSSIVSYDDQVGDYDD